MDIIERLKKLLTDSEGTPYRLSKNSAIPQSTLSSIFNRRSVSISTLEEICSHLGISMSQFFFDPEKETLYPVTEKQQAMLEKWLTLTPEQQTIIMNLIEYMNQTK